MAKVERFAQTRSMLEDLLPALSAAVVLIAALLGAFFGGRDR